MTKRDIERQLAQFPIDGQTVCVRTVIHIERLPVQARHIDVPSRSYQQRPDLLVAVEKELQRSDTCPGHRSVAGRIARVSRTAFRKCLWDQVAAICFVYGLSAEGIQDIRVQGSRSLRTP